MAQATVTDNGAVSGGVARTGVRRPEFFLVLAASVAVVAFYWAWTAWRGAVGISRADDWSYLLTQFHFGETGDFAMNNWAVTMLIGQSVTALPVTWIWGDSVVAHQAFVAVFAVLGLVLAYAFIRRYLSTAWTVLAVGALALGPIYAQSAISFMTDVPAFAWMSGALLVGSVALDRERVSFPLLALSLFLSLVAFTYRDYALLAGMTVALLALIRLRLARNSLSAALVMMVVLLGAAGALYAWRHSLPNDLKLPGWPLGYSLALTGRAAVTAALFLSPALVFVSIPRMWATLRTSQWLMFGTVLLWLTFVGVSGLQFLGNVVHPFGGTWLVSGPGVRMWPLLVNRIVFVFAALFLLIALLLVAALLVKSRQELQRNSDKGSQFKRWLEALARLGGSGVLLVFPVVLFLTHVGATLVLGAWWIDRYFILWVPFAAGAVLLAGIRHGLLTRARGTDGGSLAPSRWLAGVWLVIYAVMSLHVVDFDAMVDGTKWKMAEQAAGYEFPLNSVDGGMPFVAFHETSIGVGAQALQSQRGLPWWLERYPDQEFCRTVGFAPSAETLPGNAMEVSEFRSVLGAGGFAYVLEGPDSCSAE